MSNNILIIEDDKIINDYIEVCLKDYVSNPFKAYSGSEGIKYIKEERIDLIITDILMDNLDGFDVLDFIKKEDKNIPVIVLSALSGEEDLLKAYDLGAIDYLVKPINKELLQFKVKNILNLFREPSKGLRIDSNRYSFIIGEKEIKFTKIEFSILELLFNNQERIYTRDNLIDIIWCGSYDMSSKIIEVNIFNIRKKLGVYSKYIKTKRGVGYYFENKD